MTIQIPEQLKSSFRFILLKPKSKEAFEKGWQESANYSYDDLRLIDHLEKNGNYGVLLGHYDGAEHIVLDADTPELEKLIREKLPPTFTVRTGSGGLHFYFVIPDEN